MRKLSELSKREKMVFFRFFCDALVAVCDHQRKHGRPVHGKGVAKAAMEILRKESFFENFP
jgi:hypothetical protein